MASPIRHIAPRPDRTLIRIGDLARQTGKTVRAIHLYEELGLLEPATRSRGGFRLYLQDAIDLVRWIDLLHGLGFSLQEMRDLLKTWWQTDLGPRAMERLRELFERKLEETRAAMAHHQQLERELLDGLAYLKTCGACATPMTAVAGCAKCPQDHGMTDEPALVAGFVSRPARTRTSGRGGFVRVEDIR
jgi:MerR family copper efflux transcriptional regulator